MNPHKTAITRTRPSRPCIKIEHLLTTVIDYGCGKGLDTDYLNSKGIDCRGYDKYNPQFDKKPSLDGNTVMCNYVLNTIPIEERIEVLEDLKKACGVFISVRIDTVKGSKFRDGVITSRGTFQTQLTIGEWLEFFEEFLGEVEVLNKVGYLLVYKKYTPSNP